MKLLLSTILSLFCLFQLSAQTLVKDIYPGTTSAGINDMIVFGSELALMAGDNLDGVELWKSNGTFGGTVQVKDIYLGSGNGYPAGFELMNGWLYFRADHPSYGFEVWKSDLTTGNTTLLKDTDPGPDDGVYTSIDFEIVASNNKIYVPLNDGVYGRELWVSDGTTAGTVRLLDSYVGNIGAIPGAGDPKQMTPFGNGILFSTYDYDLNLGTGAGRELWRSNGTVGTTAMVKDIHPWCGFQQSGQFPGGRSLCLFLCQRRQQWRRIVAHRRYTRWYQSAQRHQARCVFRQ
jgi:ELWxxDGT repeat protein